MEPTVLSPMSALKDQLQQEKDKYLAAVETGKGFMEIKEIMYSITHLKNRLEEELTSQKKTGYTGL